MKYFSAKIYLLAGLLCLWGTATILAQDTKPEIGQASILNCVPATDYTVIKKGETKCLANNATLTYLTLHGGTLVIHGKARINNLSINKGTILITENGSAILPAMIFNGNVTLKNQGQVTYMGDVTLSHSNNHILNETTESKMNWGSSELNFGSNKSTFVNNGSVNVGTLRLNSKTGKVIFGNNSRINVVNLINNYDNRIYVSSGTAKLNQTGYAQLSGSLTNSADLIICPGAASELKTVSGQKNGYGKANVMTKGCLSTAVLTSF